MLDLLKEHPSIIFTAVGAFVAYKVAVAAATIKTVIHTVAEKAKAIALAQTTVATGSATVATYAYGAAMAALPIVAVIAALGAVWMSLDEFDRKLDDNIDSLIRSTDEWAELTRTINEHNQVLKELAFEYEGLKMQQEGT